MRLRFSTRLLFLGVAMVAITLGFGYVRPSALAGRFVSAVMREDYPAASGMVGLETWNGATGSQDGDRPDWIYAEVLPREWGDVWRCQRRVILRVSRHSENTGGHVEWTEDNDVIAGPFNVIITTEPRRLNIAVPAAVPGS